MNVQPYAVNGLMSTAAQNKFASEPLTGSYGYQASLFQGAVFTPPFVVGAQYGNQSPSTMEPLVTGMVPETRGIFGPLFGTVECQPPRSVGPMYDIASTSARKYSLVQDQVCPPAQDLPYRRR